MSIMSFVVIHVDLIRERLASLWIESLKLS